jgi:protein-S-isoprenylcysteine O-methyltransferase Ste14
MIRALFVLTLLFEVVYVVLFWLTIRRPDFRFWPPPKARSWQFFLAWGIVGIVGANGLLLGLLDFNSAFLPDLRSRLPAALVLAFVGSSIGLWSYVVFPLRNTFGLGEKLIVRGPYRYTRNPQYIGDSLNILAFIILTNSWMVGAIGILGILLNGLAPFTEEPWLEERFGPAYRAYKEAVPRFIGLKKAAKNQPAH